MDARKSYLSEAREYLDELARMMKEYPFHPEWAMDDLERRVKFYGDQLEAQVLDHQDGGTPTSLMVSHASNTVLQT